MLSSCYGIKKEYLVVINFWKIEWRKTIRGESRGDIFQLNAAIILKCLQEGKSRFS